MDSTENCSKPVPQPAILLSKSMGKWIFRIIAALVLGTIGFGTYDFFRAGLHTRPAMPEGAFSLSFKGGPRIIVQGIADERHERRYLVRRNLDVPDWFKDAWSFCAPPSEEETQAVSTAFGDQPGMRLEALCSLKVDGDILDTAILFSVPKV